MGPSSHNGFPCATSALASDTDLNKWPHGIPAFGCWHFPPPDTIHYDVRWPLNESPVDSYQVRRLRKCLSFTRKCCILLANENGVTQHVSCLLWPPGHNLGFHCRSAPASSVSRPAERRVGTGALLGCSLGLGLLLHKRGPQCPVQDCVEGQTEHRLETPTQDLAGGRQTPNVSSPSSFN